MKYTYKSFPIRLKFDLNRIKNRHVFFVTKKLFSPLYFQGCQRISNIKMMMHDFNRSCYVLVLLRRFWYDKICTEHADILLLGFWPLGQFMDERGTHE